MTTTNIQSSFRDPSGFVFCRDGVVYRQVNEAYKENYDHLMSSGLYDSLVGSGLLIRHEEVDSLEGAYKIIKPEPIDFISYPYEWCFSQLKDAALATLEVQREALRYDMSLKDASAYNIQFVKGKPVFIDTLSFEKYREGLPWGAYKQFCQHFLALLALASYRDIRLCQLLRVYIDGIPLDLASTLLPFRTRLNLSSMFHIHLHSWMQGRYANKSIDRSVLEGKFKHKSFLSLIDSLESCVRGLNWCSKDTEWSDYYEDDSYTSRAFTCKECVVGNFLEEVRPKLVWDLGANTGLFSRVAGNKGIRVVSFDADPACVEANYLTMKAEGDANILPLVFDLTNPSPGIGWENEERLPIWKRSCADTVLALALIHHLAISNNIPLGRIAGFLKGICSSLIIEFVPKSDPKVQKLLSTRDDVFSDYTQEAFEREFSELFVVQESVGIVDSQRVLYLMRRK